MRTPAPTLALLSCLAVAACSPGAGDDAAAGAAFLPADDAVFRYVGRVDSAPPGHAVLAGAASYVEFAFAGDSAAALVSAAEFNVDSTWVVTEVDGAYRERRAVHARDTLRLVLRAAGAPGADGLHRARVFHAAEQLMGRLLFLGTAGGDVRAWPRRPGRVAVFLGDSMSGGAASDVSAGPCGGGLSNANAYRAFPARVGRALEADYVVHAVSGRGLYTNWNGQDPPLPALLPHLYLDTADATPYRLADVDADLAVVALGTNDLNSAPDLRPAFDPARFEAAYRDLVDTLRAAYPRAALAFVGTPMHGGAENDTLNAIVARVEAYARIAYPGIAARAIPLERRELHGCPAGPHPSVEDHAVIAEEIVAGLSGLLEG